MEDLILRPGTQN